MKTFAKLSIIIALSLMLLGCATKGARFSEMQDSFSQLEPGYGRIFCYRKTSMGAAIQPKIFINDKEVGRTVPWGFFYVDRKPGNYEIKTSTEVKRTLSLTLEDGQIRYVRFNVAMGFFVGHIYPELIDNTTAISEMNKLHYVGKDKQ